MPTLRSSRPTERGTPRGVEAVGRSVSETRRELGVVRPSSRRRPEGCTLGREQEERLEEHAALPRRVTFDAFSDVSSAVSLIGCTAISYSSVSIK